MMSVSTWQVMGFLLRGVWNMLAVMLGLIIVAVLFVVSLTWLWFMVAGIVWATSFFTESGEPVFASQVLVWTAYILSLGPWMWAYLAICAGVLVVSMIWTAVTDRPPTPGVATNADDDPLAWYHD
jgi:hypothetical protein